MNLTSIEIVFLTRTRSGLGCLGQGCVTLVPGMRWKGVDCTIINSANLLIRKVYSGKEGNPPRFGTLRHFLGSLTVLFRQPCRVGK